MKNALSKKSYYKIEKNASLKVPAFWYPVCELFNQVVDYLLFQWHCQGSYYIPVSTIFKPCLYFISDIREGSDTNILLKDLAVDLL